jgi:hypothetical protein
MAATEGDADHRLAASQPGHARARLADADREGHPRRLAPTPLAAAGCRRDLCAFADRAARSAGTTVTLPEQPAALIGNGILRFPRNPTCLGLVLVLLGIAAIPRRITPCPAVPLLGVRMDRLFITAEEVNLRRALGGDWSGYRARVRL